MPLVFAAFTPHTPLIIPQIGKDHRMLLAKTEKSFSYLSDELYSSKPDTILVISAHAQLLPDAFTLNLNPTFSVSFYDFGDVVTKLTFKSDVGLTHHIKEQLETKESIVLATEEQLDHGIGVPLYSLLKPFGPKPPKIIPLMYSMLDFKRHFSFGIKLQQEILNSTKRIAVVASGELSHRLTKKSPAGYSPEGKKFDTELQQLLLKKNINGIVAMPQPFVEAAGECGFRSLLILLGILNSINYSVKVLSYEAPFGIGYLSTYFPLK